MNLKFGPIVQIFRKIIQLKAVTNLKSTNEYCRKIISKSDRKMDLYPAMELFKMTTVISCIIFLKNLDNGFKL